MQWLKEYNTREVRDLIKAFWEARQDYDFAKTRSVTDAESAIHRQNQLVDRMIELGMFTRNGHRRVPTLDEFDRVNTNPLPYGGNMKNPPANKIVHTHTFYVLWHPVKGYYKEFTDDGVATDPELTPEVYLDHNDERIRFHKEEYDRLKEFHVCEVVEKTTTEFTPKIHKVEGWED
jgi:hypothetical protein